MKDLRLIGVHEDGHHVIFAAADGERFRVPLDDALRAAARRDRPRLGQLQIEIEGGLRPRDIQALLRSGQTVAEVAERAGWTPERVARYEGPVLAERDYVATQARNVRLRTRGNAGGHTLQERVTARMRQRELDPSLGTWDSHRDSQTEWIIELTFPAGGRSRTATWSYDRSSRTVAPHNDEARWLSEDEDPTIPGPIPAPHLVGARSTGKVYDIDADGGLAPTDRKRRVSEPLDLMTAMRDRTAARSRRSSGRSGRRRGEQTSLPAIIAESGQGDSEHLQAEQIQAEPVASEKVEAEHVAPLPSEPDTLTPATALVESTEDPEPAADLEPIEDLGPSDDDFTGSGAEETAQADALQEPDGALAADAANDPVGADGPRDDLDDLDDLDDHDPALEEDLAPGPEADPETDPTTPTTPPARAKAAEPKSEGRRDGRPGVPSWDDIMFGRKPD